MRENPVKIIFRNVTIQEWAHKTHFLRQFLCFLAVFLSPLALVASGQVEEMGAYYRKYANSPMKDVYQQGMRYLSEGKMDEAQACLTVVIGRYRSDMGDDDKRIYLYALNNAGGIAMLRSDYSMAYSYFTKALEMADDSMAYRTYNNIAGIYLYYNDYDNARKSLDLAYDIGVRQQDWKSVYNTTHNILDLNWDVDSLRNSIGRIHHFRQLQILPKDSNYVFVIRICDGMELLYHHKYPEAINSFREAIKVAQGLPFQSNHEIPAYMYIAKAYFQMGDYANAISNLKICEQKSKESQALDMLIRTYQYQHRCYAEAGNLTAAREAKYRYMEIKDSVNSANEYGKIKDMQFFHEASKYEKQLAQLTAEKKVRNTVIGAIAIGLLLALMFLAFTVYQNRQLARSNKDLFKKNVALIESEEHEQLLHQQYAKKLEQYMEKDNDSERYKSSNLTDEGKEQLLGSIRQVMHNPNEFCQDDFSVDKLASLVGSNTKYVSQVINETLGKNFNTLLNEQRINEVCKRLVDVEHHGNKTNEAIAEEVGFKSRSHFIRTFKKITGLTPSQYRRMAMEQETYSS